MEQIIYGGLGVAFLAVALFGMVRLRQSGSRSTWRLAPMAAGGVTYLAAGATGSSLLAFIGLLLTVGFAVFHQVLTRRGADTGPP